MSSVTAVMPRPKPRRTARFFAANFMLAVIGAEGGIAVALGIFAQPFSDWTNPGLMVTAVSRVLAMAGTYLALVTLLLARRRKFRKCNHNYWVICCCHKALA